MVNLKKECLFAPHGAPAAGPYSHAVAAGSWLFISGQGPLKPDGSGPVRGTIEEETRQTLDNLRAVLEDCGASLEQVVKITVFLASMDDFQRFNAVYREYFPEHCPARTCVQAGRLPMDIKVEIEAIAIRNT